MERLIEYMIGGKKSYLLPNGTKITEEELDAMKKKNFESGITKNTNLLEVG